MKNDKKDDKEINPYELDKFSKIPKGLVVFFIKYWAASAAVFFIIIGGSDIGFIFTGETKDPALILATSIRIIVLIGLFLTLFMNYIVKPIVRLMNNRRCNTYRYNMINVKGIKSLFISLAYYLVVSIILFFITIFLGKHHLILDLFGTTGGTGIEPFTYGLCFLVVDSIFLGFKTLIVYLRKKHIYNKLILED